jgi:MFS family permease
LDRLGFVVSCRSNLQGLFYFYWFEDVIAPNFDVMGYHVTNSSQTALALNQAIGTVGSFVFALPGGWIGDRFGRHAVLITTGYLTCAFPIINGLLPTYGWVLVCTALGGVVGGISAGPSNALNADSMPCDAEGVPRNAGRDTMLLTTVAQLSGAVIPPVLGHLFGFFHEKRRAYRTFFFAAAALHGVSVTLLFLVDPVAEQKRLREKQTAEASAEAGAAGEARRRRLSTPMFPGDASQPAGVGACNCCCGRSGALGAAVCATVALGVVMTLMGAVCVREAVVYGILRGARNGIVSPGR